MSERRASVVYARSVRLRRLVATALTAWCVIESAYIDDEAWSQPAKISPDKPAATPSPRPASPSPTKPSPDAAKKTPPVEPKPPALVTKKPSRSVTAITDIASALDNALPAIEGRVLVGVAPLATDVAAPRGKALSMTLAQVFAGKRGYEVPTDVESLEALRGRAHGIRAIVYLAPRIVNGELLVTADAFHVPRTVWARIRNPVPGPFAHVFGKAFIDAEVRSHLEPVPITAFDAVRGRNFESGVVALACGDFDRDGAPEIVSVSKKSVTLSRIRQGRLEPLKSHLWSELSSVDPAPLREAIGFAVPSGFRVEPLAQRTVVVSITDRALAIELDADFDMVGSFIGRALPDREEYGCARLPSINVTGPFSACSATSPEPSRASVGGRYDAFASAKLVTPDGKAFQVNAGREDGSLEVFDDAGHHSNIAHVGAQIAVGDIDQDGLPEILTSLDVPNGVSDALVIYTWDRLHEKMREAMRMPIAAGVHALAMCPPESTKRSPFVMATADEVVVMR